MYARYCMSSGCPLCVRVPSSKFVYIHQLFSYGYFQHQHRLRVLIGTLRLSLCLILPCHQLGCGLARRCGVFAVAIWELLKSRRITLVSYCNARASTDIGSGAQLPANHVLHLHWRIAAEVVHVDHGAHKTTSCPEFRQELYYNVWS